MTVEERPPPSGMTTNQLLDELDWLEAQILPPPASALIADSFRHLHNVMRRVALIQVELSRRSGRGLIDD